MIGKKHIEDEEYEIERLEDNKRDLKKKWIKTPSQKREIQVLEEHIKLKKKLIDKLSKWSKKEFGAKDNRNLFKG